MSDTQTLDDLLASAYPLTPDAPPDQFSQSFHTLGPDDFDMWASRTHGNLIADRTRRQYLRDACRLIGRALKQTEVDYAGPNQNSSAEHIAGGLALTGLINLIEIVRSAEYAPSTKALYYRAIHWIMGQAAYVPASPSRELAYRMLTQARLETKGTVDEKERPWPNSDATEGGNQPGNIAAEGIGSSQSDSMFPVSKHKLNASGKKAPRDNKRMISETDFHALMEKLESGSKAGDKFFWNIRARNFFVAVISTGTRPAEWQQIHWSNKSAGLLRIPNYKRRRVPLAKVWAAGIPTELRAAAEEDLRAMGIPVALKIEEGPAPQVSTATPLQIESQDDHSFDDDIETETVTEEEMLSRLRAMISSSTGLLARVPSLATPAAWQSLRAFAGNRLAEDTPENVQIWEALVHLRAWQRRVAAVNWREIVVAPDRIADVDAHIREFRAHLAKGGTYDTYFAGCRLSLNRVSHALWPDGTGGASKIYSLYDARATALANLTATFEDAVKLAGAGGTEVASSVSRLVSAAAGHYEINVRTTRRWYPSADRAWSRKGRAKYSPTVADTETQRLIIAAMSEAPREGAAGDADAAVDGAAVVDQASDLSA